MSAIQAASSAAEIVRPVKTRRNAGIDRGVPPDVEAATNRDRSEQRLGWLLEKCAAGQQSPYLIRYSRARPETGTKAGRALR
jgi:hypothetical protein